MVDRREWDETDKREPKSRARHLYSKYNEANGKQDYKRDHRISQSLHAEQK